MSHAPFNRSADLKRLRDEGYFAQIRGGLLVMRDVPYADALSTPARAEVNGSAYPQPRR